MEEQHRGIALVILGIIAIIAVIGLVLMFSGAKNSTGALVTVQGCDSPCTIAFGASEAEVAMQTERFIARGFVPAGAIEWTYSADGFTLASQCLCPPQSTPLAPTAEQAQIVRGTPLAGRQPGVPSPMYATGPGKDYPSQYPGGLPSYPLPPNLG